ncbi:MAG: hypothetical protein KY432_11665 [Acidobacteria bacterium]|nr:hypothetical protein [Acidobacteriota bacterium]
MMRLTSVILALALTVGTGCATRSELPVERPEVRIAQASTSAFVQEQGGTFAVDYLLQIENKADIPIVAERLELQTAAAGPYAIRQTTTNFEHEIPAGGTKVIELTVWAYSYGGQTAALEPVTLKVNVRFDSARGSFHVQEIARVLQKGAIY